MSKAFVKESSDDEDDDGAGYDDRDVATHPRYGNSYSTANPEHDYDNNDGIPNETTDDGYYAQQSLAVAGTGYWATTRPPHDVSSYDYQQNDQHHQHICKPSLHLC